MEDFEFLSELEKQEFNCEHCRYNVGMIPMGSYIAGPCGQQNCWHSLAIQKILEEENN